MIPSLPLAFLKIAGGNKGQSGLSDLTHLKPGRVVDAKVLDVKPENRVQLLLPGKSDTVSGSRTRARNFSQPPSADGKTAVSTKNTPLSESGRQMPAGHKVQVSTPLPLKPGMSLTLTAVATREGPVLKPVLSTGGATGNALPASGKEDAVLKILPGRQGVADLPDAGIRPGRTVDAKVIEVTPQSRVQLLVGTQKLSVSTQLPLSQGMDLSMKVVRSQDGIVLKPLATVPGLAKPNTEGAAVDPVGSRVENCGKSLPSMAAVLRDSVPLPGGDNALRPSAFQSFSPAKILQGLGALSLAREPALNDILMGLCLKSDLRDDQFLPRIIENMGLSLENKLADALEKSGDKKTIGHVMKHLADQDLKAAALSLAGRESDPGKVSVLKHIADALDNFAQLNVKSGDSGQQHQDSTRFLIPFPVFRDDGFDFGQLMVDTGKQDSGNKGKKMLSISFLLNMTSLGPLRADFSILDKTIAGRFLLENQETCDYLAPKISDLRKRLSGIGYQAGNIDCRVAEPEQIAPASLMLSMTGPDEMQGLNVVV